MFAELKPLLGDMFEQLHGRCLFSSSDVKRCYPLPRHISVKMLKK